MGRGGERSLDLARVQRWQGADQPVEAELLRGLLAEGLEPYRWSNSAGANYSEHRHTYVKALIVVRGSISFCLTDYERTIELSPGDRLDLPAYTNHTALVGPDGVVCLEAPVK